MTHGWIILDKPPSMTSAHAVARVRKMFGKVKAGHAGTLDPIATGMLPIALGEATKTMPYFNTSDKIYEAEIGWGTATDTFDKEGKITKTGGTIPLETQIKSILPQFLGEQWQTPPAYSAVHIDGKRAYTLARMGENPVIPPRQINIFEILLIFHENKRTLLKVHASSGTYIRSLVVDIAHALGTLACLTGLRRLQVGRIHAKYLTTFAELEQQGQDAIYPPHFVLDDILAVSVEEWALPRLKNGQSVMLDQAYPPQTAYLLHMGTLVAMGRVDEALFIPTRVLHTF
jgi:tRNA pseudouridine55 synthase